MAKDHGSSVKNDKQYEGLRKNWVSTSLPRFQAGPGYAADWLVSVL
jgi:hypothetical protein